MTFTLTLFLSAASPREHEVQVEAVVTLSSGRYRIDRLTPLHGATIMPYELEDAYDQVIDKARFLGMSDEARG